MQHLPAPWRGLAVLRHFPDVISNAAYDRIALNRYKLFGRYSEQHALTPDYPDRFLHPMPSEG
jgi:predicted DCC family thiol-disulfide oxidoreductase YuxK